MNKVLMLVVFMSGTTLILNAKNNEQQGIKLVHHFAEKKINTIIEGS